MTSANYVGEGSNHCTQSHEVNSVKGVYDPSPKRSRLAYIHTIVYDVEEFETIRSVGVRAVTFRTHERAHV